jgi:hypothetical protein
MYSFFIFFFLCGDKTCGTIFYTCGTPSFPSFFICMFPFPSLHFFVVDNQAFGSDKGKSLAKDQCDVISLDDLLVDKLGAVVARNYSFDIENCK